LSISRDPQIKPYDPTLAGGEGKKVAFSRSPLRLEQQRYPSPPQLLFTPLIRVFFISLIPVMIGLPGILFS